MKKGLKITLIILGILILLALIFFAIDYSRVQKQEKPLFCIKVETYRDGGTKEYYGLGYKIIDFNMLDGYDEIKIGTWFMKYTDFKREYETSENNNIVANIRAVVVKVYDNSLVVMRIENTNELISVGFTEEGNIGFAQGQEILIYFDGMIMESYPAQLGNVTKIEIAKEKSDLQIPDNILRYCYSSRDNVNVTVSELTRSGISLTITDTNELPYNYSHSYTIYNKVKNENYNGIGYKIGEDTENSTSGFTRNRYRIYMERSK